MAVSAHRPGVASSSYSRTIWRECAVFGGHLVKLYLPESSRKTPRRYDWTYGIDKKKSGYGFCLLTKTGPTRIFPGRIHSWCRQCADSDAIGNNIMIFCDEFRFCVPSQCVVR